MFLPASPNKLKHAVLTIKPRPLICSQLGIILRSSSSKRAILSSGEPPIDRCWLLFAFIGRSHHRDQNREMITIDLQFVWSSEVYVIIDIRKKGYQHRSLCHIVFLQYFRSRGGHPLSPKMLYSEGIHSSNEI